MGDINISIPKKPDWLGWPRSPIVQTILVLTAFVVLGTLVVLFASGVVGYGSQVESYTGIIVDIKVSGNGQTLYFESGRVITMRQIDNSLVIGYEYTITDTGGWRVQE